MSGYTAVNEAFRLAKKKNTLMHDMLRKRAGDGLQGVIKQKPELKEKPVNKVKKRA